MRDAFKKSFKKSRIIDCTGWKVSMDRAKGASELRMPTHTQCVFCILRNSKQVIGTMEFPAYASLDALALVWHVKSRKAKRGLGI